MKQLSIQFDLYEVSTEVSSSKCCSRDVDAMCHEFCKRRAELEVMREEEGGLVETSSMEEGIKREGAESVACSTYR